MKSLDDLLAEYTKQVQESDEEMSYAYEGSFKDESFECCSLCGCLTCVSI